MNQSLAIGVSVVVVYALVLLIGKKFRLSTRYERSPRIQDPWRALDNGIDPSEDNRQ